MQVVALILAAGNGSRFGGRLPKQYCYLGDDIVLNKAIKAFSEINEIDAVQVVISADYLELYSSLVCDDEKLLPVCFGGQSRQESARLGLKAIKNLNPSKVLIHDAARPYVESKLVGNVLSLLEEYKAVDIAIPLVDTVKMRNGKQVTMLNREDLYITQTPQGFEYKEIMQAHLSTEQVCATDDIGLMIERGHKIGIVHGNSSNIKITHAHDINHQRNKEGNNGMNMRIGSGFDVHKFADEEKECYIKIGGVDIKHSHSLVAHSDGDVVLHALTDALLGAIAEGDIGEHFPPTDQRWRNADSIIFLQHANSLVKKRGANILNIDITIICQMPKIFSYRAAIRQKIANSLNISEGLVSVKATTTEGLGFTGRKEGIAAQAVCLLSAPID